MKYAAEQGRVADCRSFQRPGRRPKGKAVVQRRILQTRIEDLTLVSVDPVFAQYEVPLVEG